jgi:hypothetical protein
MSIEFKVDGSPKFGKSIKENSTQCFIDSKFCRLNSGHPNHVNLKNKLCYEQLF